MSNYLDEHQRDELLTSFLRAKDKERMLFKLAKKFASQNNRMGGSPRQDEVDAHLGACRNTIASCHGEVHLAYCEWKKIPPNPKKLSYSYDYAMNLMSLAEKHGKYKDTKRNKERLAKELTSRGAKQLFKGLYELFKEGILDEEHVNKSIELETLHLRQSEIANMLSAISDLSVVDGDDTFRAWINCLEFKRLFIKDVEEELKDAKGSTRTAIKNIVDKTSPIKKDLPQIIKHLEINSYAVRLLRNFYFNDVFEELKESHLRLALGLAYSQLEEYNDMSYGEDCILHGHNSILIEGKEIVFKNKYLDNQILYTPKNPYVKKIIAFAEKGEADFKKILKRTEKKLEGRLISYRWNKFFKNSIDIDYDHIEMIKSVMNPHDFHEVTFTDTYHNDVYYNVTRQTEIIKNWRASQYRGGKLLEGYNQSYATRNEKKKK